MSAAVTVPHLDVLADVVDLVATATPADTRLEQARALIAGAGVRPNAHVGTAPEAFDAAMYVEWILGSAADIIDTRSWFAMKRWLVAARMTLDAYRD